MTPEGKVKVWARRKGGAFDVVFPGHVRVSPRGGPFASTGVADDILCWYGLFIAIEIKPNDGSASDLQMKFLREVVAAGGIGALLKGKDWHKLELVKARALERIQCRST